MIADKVKQYLEGTGDCIPEERLATMLDLVAHSVQRNLGDNSGERATRKIRNPRPSGTWACGREMVFKSLALEGEPYGWRSRLTFTHGDMTEAMGVLLFQQAMDSLGTPEVIASPAPDGEQLHLDVMVDPAVWGVEGPHFRMEGHLDMTIRGHDGGEDVCDWKSASTYSFQDVERAASDPSFKWWTKEAGGYIAQVRWYMMMLRLTGRGKGERGYLVSVNKNTGHLAEVLIKHDYEAERLLVRKAVYTARMIAEGAERRAIALQDHAGANDLPEINALMFQGDATTDAVLAGWVRDNIPRAPFTKAMVVKKTGSNKRPDGTKGACLELDMSADHQAFRCSYCDFTEHCWPTFSVVPLGKPVYRTNGIPEGK